jgi:hypothetical protein
MPTKVGIHDWQWLPAKKAWMPTFVGMTRGQHRSRFIQGGSAVQAGGNSQ